jgi:alpha-D-ribose 1-methylphosphonate 5-triphosphate synthase subunit PhnG
MDTSSKLLDTPTVAPAVRRDWLAVLARAPLDMLEGAFTFLHVPEYRWLRHPETGIYMIRARIGGSGNRFNMGEVTVTRCVLRLSEGPTGLGYVLGRSHRHAELCALADAMLQGGLQRNLVHNGVIAPVKRYLDDQRSRMARKAQSTRVEFLTVAREAAPALAESTGTGEAPSTANSLSEGTA